MAKDAETEALALIARTADPDKLRQILTNAGGKSEMVEKAAFRRLAEASAKHRPGTVQHECWMMIHAVEELRRLAGRKVTRMNRMRPKIEREGEVAALEYCALRETDGFSEVLAYGMPELIAEAIVLRLKGHFSPAAATAGRGRLAGAGVKIDETGSAC